MTLLKTEMTAGRHRRIRDSDNCPGTAGTARGATPGGTPMQDQPTGPNPSGLCMCGCGARTKIAPKTDTKKGNIKRTPRRYLPGHMHLRTPLEYVEEDHGYLTPCWIWQRQITRNGYGVATMPGKTTGASRQTGAHRVFYVRYKGPIPEGLHLDHLCRIPPCVNPDHLEPVTNAENARRGAACKLTVEKVRQIRATDRDALELALEHGVSRNTIYAVRGRVHWRDV